MPRELTPFVAVWVFALGLAVLLSIAAHESGPLSGDEQIADWVQDWPGWFETIAEGVRAITATQVVLVTGALVVLGLWSTGRRFEAIALLVLLLILPFLQAGLKDIVDRPRPTPPSWSGAPASTARASPPGTS